MIEANTRKDWIMQQAVTKFGGLKIASGGDAVMSSDAKYHHTTCNKLIKLSSLSAIIRTPHCICTVISFEATKFCHHMLQDPILLEINFNHVSIQYDNVITIIRWDIKFTYNANYEKYKLGIWPQDGHNIVTLDEK